MVIVVMVIILLLLFLVIIFKAKMVILFLLFFYLIIFIIILICCHCCYRCHWLLSKYGNRTFIKVWFDLLFLLLISFLWWILLLGLDYLLTPDKIHAKARSTVFKDVWAGSYNTIVRSTEVCFLFIFYSFIHFFFLLVRWNFVHLVIDVFSLSSL